MTRDVAPHLRAESATSQPGPARDAGEHPRALIESALERLLASAVFRRSERHRRFLRHVVKATLDGHQDQLKEVLLGIALFDRRIETYDVRVDPIVRVEAGRVREKLSRYYEGDGAADLLVFEIPVGSYVPRFERRGAGGHAERAIESFVVMPFACADQEADVSFAIGLADQLIDRLGRVRHLKVIARFSAFQARERNLDARAIGRLLKATRIVDGSLQRQGDRLRCVAHIYQARDGVRLWSQSFDSKTEGLGADGVVDLFAFQDRITETVLKAASPAASDDEAPSDAGRVRSTTAAHERAARDLLERARYMGRRYDAASTEKVIALVGEAIALDPDNAPAHVALATACLHQTTLLKAPGSTALPRVEAALDRAIALDPRDGDAIALRAMIAFRFSFDWDRSERLFREALRISAHTSSLNYRFAFGLILNGRFAEGLSHARTAVDLDPLNLSMRAWGAQLLVFAREYARAEIDARDVLELEPDHLYTTYVLGLIHLYRREYACALARFTALTTLYPDHHAGHLCRITARGLLGDVEGGHRDLEAYLARLDGRYCPAFNLAKAQVALGERAVAYATLERGIREHDASICSLPIDPVFAPCHDDPVFLALLARIGLRPPVA